MKTKFTLFCAIILFMALYTTASYSQVTIGSGIPPAKGALLDLKQNEGLITASKGLGLPRVNLVANNSLDPCVVITPANKEKMEATHVGLFLYNSGAEVLTSKEAQLCKGMHVWNGKKWQPLTPYPKNRLIICEGGAMVTINCSNISVKGTYKVGAPLDDTHYMEVNVTFPSLDIGKSYNIEATDDISGISFAATGTVINTSQKIKLAGSGRVESVETMQIPVYTNSSESAVCNITIQPMLPQMKITGVGNETYHPANSMAKSNTLLTNPLAFGPTAAAKVKVEGFVFDNRTVPLPDANAWINIFKSQPDIVIRAYVDHFGGINNVAVQAALYEYLQKGGVFIELNDNNGVSSNGVKAVYGTGASSNTGAGDVGQFFTFNNVNDEVIKGPWGDLAGKTWAEDASYTQGIKGVPLDRIIVYSTGNNGLPVMFRDKDLNYFYIGDGGFLSGYDAESACCYPFRLDSNNLPANGISNNKYHSAAFANIMTWAIKQATKTKLKNLK